MLSTYRPLAIALTAALSATATPSAAAAPPLDVRAEIESLAFDPKTFFTGNGTDLVRIAYRGDDWGWPVYAIAIRSGCGIARDKGCDQRRIARMVRAPVPERGAARIRWRGSALVGAIGAKKPTTRAEVATLIDSAGLDWVEADLTSCPGAIAALAATGSLDWIARGLAPSPATDLEIVLHADRVLVEFPYYSWSTTYDGYIAPRSPADWAVKLAAVLEPCWKPATAPKPWLRTAK